MIKKLEENRWEELYKKHMQIDFPQNELYSLNAFLKEKEKKNVYIYEENGIEKAYLVTGENENIIFIFYFAVFAEYRSKGIGSKFLKEYISMVKNGKTIVLEIEDPSKTEDKKEYQKRDRRKSFYEKLGFVHEKRIKEYYFFEYYIILTFGKKLPIKEIEDGVKDIYNVITNPVIMNKLKIKVCEEKF